MNAKSIIWVCTIVGSAIGSYIPNLWGAGGISFSSIFFSAIGAIAGIWIGYSISRI